MDFVSTFIKYLNTNKFFNYSTGEGIIFKTEYLKGVMIF